jgi:hypothetical protein
MTTETSNPKTSKPRSEKKLVELIDFPRLRTNDLGSTPILNTEGFGRYNCSALGIEVEVENINGIRGPQHSWTHTNDGSLRNNGIEFVSLPTKPEHIETAVSHLFDDVIPKTAHFSPRTSVHVHMNVRDLTFNQIFNVVLLYQCFEDLLYKFAGPERKKSIFCVPIGNTGYYTNLKTYCLARELISWSKYTGLNLNPLRNYGTIEFRHLRGTRDKQVVFEWLHFLLSIYSFAISKTTEELETLIKDVSNSRDYSSLGWAVFGPRFHRLAPDTIYMKTMREDIAISKLFMNTKRYI